MAFGQRKEETKVQVSTTQSVFAKDLSIKGDVFCTGLLRVEGKIEGSIKGSGEITIAENGEVIGDVEGRKVIILGKVKGNIFAKESLEIIASSEVTGDATTEKILIEEGAVFNGKINTKIKEEPKKEEPLKEEKKIV